MLIRRNAGLAAILAIVACSACTLHGAKLSRGPAAQAAAVDAQSRRIVASADAFLATLNDSQRKSVLFAFTDSAQRARWSNFPDGGAQRLGVRWGELNASQRAALMRLLGVVLSPGGVKMVTEMMAADDIVRDTPPNVPAGRRLPSQNAGAPPVHFGADYYFVSFVGTPSTTTPWMLQFGGHHLAINATVVGPNVTLSPTLSGGEPLKFIKDGQPVFVTSEESTKGLAFLNSLNAEQRGRAVVSNQMINLVLGPGHDGQVLQPEGLSAAEMTTLQKAQFLGVIEARLNMLNADDLAAAMSRIRRDLDRTYFAWFGPAALGEAYFRITGPSVIIEFSPQANDFRFPDVTQHAHNMYRDPTNEYGAAWTSLN